MLVFKWLWRKTFARESERPYYYDKKMKRYRDSYTGKFISVKKGRRVESTRKPYHLYGIDPVQNK